MFACCRLTYSIYRVVSVALFSRHQLTFSTMLATSIMRANTNYEDIAGVGTIPSLEWQSFLQGNILASMMDERTRDEFDGEGRYIRVLCICVADASCLANCYVHCIVSKRGYLLKFCVIKEFIYNHRNYPNHNLVWFSHL